MYQKHQKNSPLKTYQNTGNSHQVYLERVEAISGLNKCKSSSVPGSRFKQTKCIIYIKRHINVDVTSSWTIGLLHIQQYCFIKYHYNFICMRVQSPDSLPTLTNHHVNISVITLFAYCTYVTDCTFSILN